jgi:hypothetical protein
MKPMDPIIYPRLKTIVSLIDACRQQSGKTTSPKGKGITGPVGVGKQTLVKYYAHQALQSDFEDEPSLPVLYFIMPIPCSPDAILHTMLHSLGRTSSFTYKSPRLADLVVKWLEKCRTKLIIIEDFQHLLSTRQKTQQEETKQYLYKVMASAKVPAVMIYPTIPPSQVLRLSDVLTELNANELILKPFAWDKSNPGSIQEFAYVVQAFEERLAVTLPWIEEPRNKLLARIYFATDGVMSSLAKLLRVSASYARTEKTYQISLELLASVFEKRLAYRRQLEINPFDPGWREPKQIFED